MKIVLIRHGEPDYTDVTKREFIGYGLDLAHLTIEGKELETAAIISRYRNVEIEVEFNLHEWFPDLTYAFSNDDFAISASKLCSENKGIFPENSPMKYEELATVFKRANDCL